MTSALVRGIGSLERAAITALTMALCPGVPILAAPPAPPVTSTGAPRASAPVVKVAGMTLEIRSGRVVVTDVAKGSPSDRAGVLPLDVVLEANDRSLVDLDPISPGQVLGLLLQEPSPRVRLVLGRGAGTLSVDLPRGPDGPRAAATPPELRPGVPSPVFRGRDINGKEISIESLRGSLVLIDFWASGCPPCERAVIPLRRIAEQHKGKLQIVGVSLDDDRKEFEAFVYNHHLPGSQLYDGASWGGEASRLYRVPEIGVPYYVLIDRDGRIAALGRLEAVEEALSRLAGTPR